MNTVAGPAVNGTREKLSLSGTTLPGGGLSSKRKKFLIPTEVSHSTVGVATHVPSKLIMSLKFHTHHLDLHVT